MASLVLMIAKLAEQTLAQVATGHARRVELADYLESFLQVGGREVRFVWRGLQLLRYLWCPATAPRHFLPPK